MQFTQDEYRDLLWQYHQQRGSGNSCSPGEFLRGKEVPHRVQLKVIATDWEMAMSDGVRPSITNYLDEFPHLGDELRDLLPNMTSDFIREFQPIRLNRVGGVLVDGFAIEKELDRGGMGVVYRGKQISSGRDVALKLLFFSRLGIHHEAELIRRVNHPCVCSFVAVGNIKGYPALAMHLAEGTLLSAQMGSRIFDVPEVIHIVANLAEALAAVHDAGIVHLDVKPGNVIVGPKDHPTLIDFGLAKNRQELWATGETLPIASPAYCSPEQLSRQFGYIGHRSDIYSLGVMLYEMLTGRRVHNGKTAQVVDQLANDPPRRPTDYNSRVPKELEAICLKAIKAMPQERFSTMAEFSSALNSLENEVPKIGEPEHSF